MFSKINLDSLVSSTGVSSRTNSRAAENRPVSQNFDQIDISSRPTGEEKKILDLVSQISQDIRIRPTHNELKALGEQVQNGSYEPNPDDIAAALLLVNKEDF